MIRIASIAILVVAAVIGLLFFSLPEFEQARARLRQPLQDLRFALRSVVQGLWEAMWCWAYIAAWRLWLVFRSRVVRSLASIGAFITLFILFDVVHILVSDPLLIHHLPKREELMLTAFAGKLPKPVEPPLYIEIASVLIAVALAWHRVSEWKGDRRNESLPEKIEEIITNSTTLSDGPYPWGTPRDSEVWELIIPRFLQVLDVRRPRKVQASLMIVEKEKLVVKYTSPPKGKCGFDLSLELAIREGAAGCACANKHAIYVPSIRHRAGINPESILPEGFYAVKEDKREPFQSLLCVPVCVGEKAVGVLIFASEERGAFELYDYRLMRLCVALFASFFA